MSLSADEYREHLATTTRPRRLQFDDVVLPGEGDIRSGRIAAIHYLDWGNKGHADRSCSCTAAR